VLRKNPSKSRTQEMRIIAFFLFLILLSPTAHAQNVEHIGQSESQLSVYEEDLLAHDIEILTPNYTFVSSIFSSIELSEVSVATVVSSEPIESEEEKLPMAKTQSFFEVGTHYSFELDEAFELIQFEFIPHAVSIDSYFQFHLISPDGDETIRYNLEEFTMSQPSLGGYEFYVEGNGFSTYDLAVSNRHFSLNETLSENESAESESAYFVIDPNFEATTNQLSEIQTFSDAGGDFIVISNSDVAEYFGVYFSTYNFDRPLKDSEKSSGYSFFDETVLDVIDGFVAPTNCASFGNIPIEDSYLFVRYYCFSPDGELSSLIFLSEDVFSGDRTKDFSNLLFNTLLPPYPTTLEDPQTFSLSKVSPLDQLNTGYYWMIVSGFLLLGSLIIWVISRWLWTPLKALVKTRHQETILWGRKLSETDRNRIFLVFSLSSVYFLYDFFIFNRWTSWFFLIPLCFGIAAHYSINSRPTKWGKKLNKKIWGIYALILLIPVFVALGRMNSQIKSDNVFSLNLIERSNHYFSLTNTTNGNINGNIWGIAEAAYLFSAGPIQLNFRLPAFISPDEILLRTHMRSSDPIKIRARSNQNAPSYFSEPINSFVHLESLDDVEIYRKKSSPVVSSSNQDSEWLSYIDDEFPQDTSFGLMGDIDLNENDFLLENFDAQEAPEAVKYLMNLAPSGGTFYAYLEESLDLLIAFDDLSGDVDVDFPSMNGTPTIERNDTDKTIRATMDNLTPGIYYFSIEPKNSNSIVSSLSLNSNHLVFRTDELVSYEDDLHFMPISDLYLSYESEVTGVEFSQLPGSAFIGPENESHESFGFLKIDHRMYSLNFPAIKSQLSASSPVIYSFTESSWFNPFKYNFSTSSSNNDYLITRDYNGPFEQEDDWILFEDFFEVSPLNGQIQFEIDFVDPRADTWMMIRDFEIEIL
jgi:hypothetical protein